MPNPTDSPAQFATTHWSVVMEAKSSPEGASALEELAKAYWQPIYWFLRRDGHAVADAQDLTQEFFARLLSSNFLEPVERSRGKFRNYLLACLKNFLANEHRGSKAQKRGGEATFVQFDELLEQQYSGSKPQDWDAQTLFDRRWALATVAQALAKLEKESRSSGKAAQFNLLKPYLSSNGADIDARAVCQQLQLSPEALRVAVHRLRHRYRDLLLQECAQAVSSKEEAAEEMGYLLSLLSRAPTGNTQTITAPGS